jgi:PAS domain-containing protein
MGPNRRAQERERAAARAPRKPSAPRLSAEPVPIPCAYIRRSRVSNRSAGLLCRGRAKPHRRKQRLSRVRAALDEIEVGIILLDQELRLTFVNRAFLRMWQLSSEAAADLDFEGLMRLRAHAMFGWRKGRSFE